jgi:hypothetical protein
MVNMYVFQHEDLLGNTKIEHVNLFDISIEIVSISTLIKFKLFKQQSLFVVKLTSGLLAQVFCKPN